MKAINSDSVLMHRHSLFFIPLVTIRVHRRSRAVVPDRDSIGRVLCIRTSVMLRNSLWPDLSRADLDTLLMPQLYLLP